MLQDVLDAFDLTVRAEKIFFDAAGIFRNVSWDPSLQMLSQNEKRLFEFIERMHSARSLPHLHEILVHGMEALISGDCFDLAFFGADATAEECSITSSGAFTPAELAFQLEHAMEHPLARCFADGLSGAFQISQFVSPAQWKNTGVYSEGGYGRLGLGYELAVDLHGLTLPTIAAFSIVRASMDFSQAEREVLATLRPHICRAWQQTQQRGRSSSPELLRRLFPVLSPREAEILYWVVEGKQNAEIAAILERRLSTIQEHVENIIAKLGMENRHQMTVTVLRLAAT